MPSWKFTNWASLLFLVLAFFFIYRYPSSLSSSTQNMAEETPKSVYDFTVKDIRGNDVALSNYKGKVLLIVNVASKCGFTQSNYKELNVLYERYKDQGFEILAFPCNQFGWQEPGTNEEIQDTVCTMFKAEFPIFDKTEVNGKNAAPLYKFLKAEKGVYWLTALNGTSQSFWWIKKERFWRDMPPQHLLSKSRKTYRICWDLPKHQGHTKAGWGLYKLQAIEASLISYMLVRSNCYACFIYACKVKLLCLHILG